MQWNMNQNRQFKHGKPALKGRLRTERYAKIKDKQFLRDPSHARRLKQIPSLSIRPFVKNNVKCDVRKINKSLFLPENQTAFGYFSTLS